MQRLRGSIQASFSQDVSHRWSSNFFDHTLTAPVAARAAAALAFIRFRLRTSCHILGRREQLVESESSSH